jgi:hypothetical protein
MSNLKVGLILVGQMRTYESKLIIASYNAFFAGMNIDLYICTWANKGHSNHHGLLNYNHSYTNDTITEDSLRGHYSQFPFLSLKKIKINTFSEWYNSLDHAYKHIYHTPFSGHANHNTSVPAEFIYQDAITLLPNETIYDRVIILRPDMALIDKIPISITDDSNTIYFQCICEGCMDHSWFATQETIVKQLHDIYSAYISNKNDTQSTDNNVLLHHQARKKNIHVKCYVKHLLTQIV